MALSITTQDQFAGALLDLDRTVPDGLTTWNLARPERRFSVYRNNVRTGLVRALASRFPVAEKIVGEAFFAAMAQAFIALHPPKSPILLDYGDDFADFLETSHPAAELAYLPDVVRLEAARGKAYHAEDLPPLDPAILADFDTDALPALTLAFHPSVSVVRSVHPIVTIWAMNVGEIQLSPIEAWNGEDALVARPHLKVLVQRLPLGGAEFLIALMSGATLAAALEPVLAKVDGFDLVANLAGLLRSGAIAGIK
jgi:Putative DNA-binding domain